MQSLGNSSSGGVLLLPESLRSSAGRLPAFILQSCCFHAQMAICQRIGPCCMQVSIEESHLVSTPDGRSLAHDTSLQYPWHEAGFLRCGINQPAKLPSLCIASCTRCTGSLLAMQPRSSSFSHAAITLSRMP